MRDCSSQLLLAALEALGKVLQEGRPFLGQDKPEDDDIAWVVVEMGSEVNIPCPPVCITIFNLCSLTKDGKITESNQR